MSIYPSAIDGFEQIPLVVDGVTRINAVSVNVLREAILNIETELGIVPSGSFDTVSDRLDDIETRILELETLMDSIVVGGGVIPSGTGFVHITSGSQDPTAKLVENADVSSSAAIVESKLSLNFPTHSSSNDPTASEKAALAGTSGTPSIANPYVTTDDPRLDEFTVSQDGLVPSPGSSTGLFLQDDGTWAAPSGGSGDVVGPASSTDNAVARFNLATGKLIQDSVVIVGDTGNITGLGTLNTHTLPGGTGTIALTSDIPSAYTDELAQDAVGTILTDTTTIDLIYTDSTPTITADVRTNSISNTLLAQVNTQTFKGRTTASTGNVEDLTATQATAILNSFVGDSGAGGTKGLVPAPAAGDTAALKFLKADGTWEIPTGGSGTRTVFTYQPGGVDDPDNGLYIDFDELYTAALAVSVDNNLVTIIIDDRFTSPAVIPDGSFDLRNISFIGVCAFINETFFLTAMETGETIFENWFTGLNFLSLTHTGTLALMLIPFDDPANTIRTGFASTYTAELAPIWSHVDDGYMGERDVVVIADPGTTFSGLGGYEIFEVQSPNQVFVNCVGRFDLGAQTLRGDGNFIFSRSAINGDFDLTQPNLGGTLTVSNFDPNYTPADESDWNTVPTLMSQALDELADVVANLGAGSGDVVGPASATDNAVVRFDSTTGKLIKDSTVIMDNSGNLTGLGTLNTHTIPGGTGTIALTSDVAELAQDAVGTILTDTATIDFIYTDLTPTITADVKTNSITNSLLAQVNTATFKGRTSSSTGNVEDLTVTQATALLNNFVGDSGSGGTKGLVPAPAAGDAAAVKFLKADGTWAVPAGGLTQGQVVALVAGAALP